MNKFNGGPPREENLPAVPEVDPFADAFAGQENVDASDVVVPRMKLIQALSPEKSRQRPEFIPGIEEGDFFNTATRQFYKGQEGILLVPCYYLKRYLEWLPRGQGDTRNQPPVGEHDKSILDRCREDEDKRLRLENGNYIAVTPEFYCLHVLSSGIAERVVMSMPGSKARVAKQWNTLIRSRQLENPKTKQLVIMPMFYGAYRMTSVGTSNADGDFFVPSIMFDKPTTQISNSIYLAAKEFWEQARSGAVRAAAENDDGMGSDTSGAERRSRVGGSDMPF